MTSSCGLLSKGGGIAAAPGVRRRNALWRLVGILAVVPIVSIGCSNPLSPLADPQLPKDPGTVVVQVRDQADLPVASAYVCVVMPNNVGSFFGTCASTSVNGRITFSSVSAGRRRVEVRPPAGFSATPEALNRDVDVLKDASVIVDFQLTRN
jgi:hypothetical protein